MFLRFPPPQLPPKATSSSRLPNSVAGDEQISVKGCALEIPTNEELAQGFPVSLKTASRATFLERLGDLPTFRGRYYASRRHPHSAIKRDLNKNPLPPKDPKPLTSEQLDEKEENERKSPQRRRRSRTNTIFEI